MDGRRRQVIEVVFSGCIFLLVAVIVSAQAFEPLVLYDDFNGELIEPDKWFGGEFLGASQESVRTIQGSRLYLFSRAYGKTDSDNGHLFSDVALLFSNSPAVMAIEAAVQVTMFKVIECPTNPIAAFLPQPGARLAGFFFNTDTPIPYSHVNDVLAAIGIGRQSALIDQENVLHVFTVVFHCADQFCTAGTFLDSADLGPLNIGENVELKIRWDPENNQFMFQRDDEPEIVSSYAPLSDTAAPSVALKGLDMITIVANCKAGSRPMASMDALFDDVFVNESATPPCQDTARKKCTSDADCGEGFSCWYQIPRGPSPGIRGSTENPGECWSNDVIYQTN